jgi:hypothetical protein
VAAVALRGALDLIARAGGGVVEAYPQDTRGKRTSGCFLYNARRTLFERAGFTYDRPKDKNQLRDAHDRPTELRKPLVVPHPGRRRSAQGSTRTTSRVEPDVA